MKNPIALRSIGACDQLIQSMQDGNIDSYKAARDMLVRLTKRKISILRLVMGLRLLAEQEASFKEEDPGVDST